MWRRTKTNKMQFLDTKTNTYTAGRGLRACLNAAVFARTALCLMLLNAYKNEACVTQMFSFTIKTCTAHMPYAPTRLRAYIHKHHFGKRSHIKHVDEARKAPHA